MIQAHTFSQRNSMTFRSLEEKQ
uniref:Uncharacterized protein n=1 Tax=Anguilla anguilla TaxID=7936 RepID=A0A0E9SPX6_ANGAN